MSYSSGELLEQALEYVMNGKEIPGVKAVGKVLLPDGEEFKRRNEVRQILVDYGARESVKRPMSIAVFGPPGSGKSTCVASLLESVNPTFTREYVGDRTINLSQVTSPSALAKHIDQKLKQGDTASGKAPKILFFDEFDAQLGDVALGWLRWFLAPMQDGMLFADGATIEFGKSILFFAGGTADSLAEFERRAKMDEREYRARKVPDFVSRLHGFIDIEGINGTDDMRPVRRALALRRFLNTRWKGHDKGGEFPVAEELARKLLTTAHYIHGMRSLEALLETSRLKKGTVLKEANLPDMELRRLHVSRGPLDGKLIGVSAGLYDENNWPLLKELTHTLLGCGASIAYGGDFIPGGTLESVVNAAKDVPNALIDNGEKRLCNYLCFPSYLSDRVQQHRTVAEQYVEFKELKTLSRVEQGIFEVPTDAFFEAIPKKKKRYEPKHHLAWAISLFRMRVRLCQDVHALIVLGGKEKDSWGRFSGIAEEVMLAIALGKPVYLLGGCEGATESVGKLLGLGEAIVHVDDCLHDPGRVGPKDFPLDGYFSLPGYEKLPDSIEKLRSWLQEHSVWSEAWPYNGLTTEENRDLFHMAPSDTEKGACVNLIMSGLLRLDWQR